jgi:hypothetical protein
VKACPKCGVRQIADKEWACKSCKAEIVKRGSLSGAPAAMVPCPSCRSLVSTKASACPHCGHLFRSPNAVNLRDPVHVIGLILCGLFIAAALAGLIL